jgi:hypothetical protein
MPNQREYRTIADYMKAFDRMFLVLPDAVAAEHKREIELHLRQLAQQSMRDGMTEEDAERQAIATFGPPREVARPLVTRWLKTARKSATSTSKILGILSLMIAGFLTGFVALISDTSPELLQISIALTCGLVGGVATAFSSLGSEDEMPPEVKEIVCHRFEKLILQLQQPRFNENPVQRLHRRVTIWHVRGIFKDMIEREKDQLAKLNRNFFLAYGVAFLLMNLCPVPAVVTRMTDFILADLMAMRITAALRQHFEQRPRV